MVNDSSANPRRKAPHVNRTRTNTTMNALTQRARTILNDSSLDPESRAIIRKEEETNREKIEALAEIICREGEESAAALFVLMGTLQNSPEPDAIANTLKHFAFERCSQFNLHGMVDAQIDIVERELFAATS